VGKMSILVTGGAGYIGSVTVELLCRQGLTPVVLDNLVCGHRAAVSPQARFYLGDIGDAGLVRQICAEHKIEACIHFAAFAYVGESVTNPAKYFQNNVGQGIKLLDALVGAGVRNIVFSSTCATYGEPQAIPIDESHPQSPANPYGWSKFMMERILESYDHAFGLKFVALRYFNAAGATANCGEQHDPETHLIPNVLAAATGALPSVSVFGGDYPTPDGTCIRDYIHVSDLGDAHLRALAYLREGGDSTHINLGNGLGFSVLEVIETARLVTGRSIPAKIEPSRPGDPSRLIANAEKARKALGWQPQQASLREIIATAWAWKQKHPQGYPGNL
jgi:UDP-glucose 4-epimerase